MAGFLSPKGTTNTVSSALFWRGFCMVKGEGPRVENDGLRGLSVNKC